MSEHDDSDAARGDASSPSRRQDGPLPSGQGGRPRALDDQGKRAIVAALNKGFNLAQAAAYAACTRRTISRERRRDPEFDENVKRAISLQGMAPLDVVIQASRTDWRAAAWLVKHLDRLQKDEVLARELKLSREAYEEASRLAHDAENPAVGGFSPTARFRYPPPDASPLDDREGNGHEGNGHEGNGHGEAPPSG